MRQFTVGGSVQVFSLRGLAVLLVSLNGVCCDIAIAAGLHLPRENWFLSKVQALGQAPLPRTMVLRGPSPDTERTAAFITSMGSFDVFLAPLGDTWPRTVEKLDLENSDSCRSAAETLSTDFKIQCIHRATPEPLPGCTLLVDLLGPAGVIERASIYVVLQNGAPCPLYDSLAPPSSYSLPGKPLRPWGGSRLVAEVASPTAQSILRAIGIESGGHDH
jgi:hypothetical protein